MTNQIERVRVVGRGRLGATLAAALRETGHAVDDAADLVILCVPDAEIEAAAADLKGSARLAGHTSGATPLSALEPAGAEARFGLHPLQTFPTPVEQRALSRFAGVGCAVAGSTPAALSAATGLAESLGMRPFPIDDAGRAAYHAAASVASNFLVTLEAAAERIASGAGIDPVDARELLAPLVRSTVENWAELGPERALTGPVARGDRETVERQRTAVAEAAPELLSLFDELVERTRALAGGTVPA